MEVTRKTKSNFVHDNYNLVERYNARINVAHKATKTVSRLTNRLSKDVVSDIMTLVAEAGKNK